MGGSGWEHCSAKRMQRIAVVRRGVGEVVGCGLAWWLGFGQYFRILRASDLRDI